ncbi:hypothetical protein KSS87_020718 [Heliosperma pusillum]|nr:hypothetical protein KSS87_020718 [Heliosperma pusillum]
MLTFPNCSDSTVAIFHEFSGISTLLITRTLLSSIFYSQGSAYIHDAVTLFYNQLTSSDEIFSSSFDAAMYLNSIQFPL